MFLKKYVLVNNFFTLSSTLFIVRDGKGHGAWAYKRETKVKGHGLIKEKLRSWGMA
jgi:hypothetical protein